MTTTAPKMHLVTLRCDLTGESQDVCICTDCYHNAGGYPETAPADDDIDCEICHHHNNKRTP